MGSCKDSQFITQGDIDSAGTVLSNLEWALFQP
jgi:hypothetical protein